MSIVTGLKQQKRQNRVNVYLDNKFGFGIDLDNFVLLGLRINQELSEEKVAEIVQKAEFQKTYEKLLKFAMLRPRSEREVDSWFYRKKVYEGMWRDLKNKLVNLELLDDVKFARWWIDQRNAFKPRSSRLLKMELAQKGISRDIVDNLFTETSLDEVQIAKGLAEKKPRLDKDRLVGYLSRKGFSWSTIEQVLEELKRA